MGKVNWATSLGGDRPLDRQFLGYLNAFGGGDLRETYTRDSAVLSTTTRSLDSNRSCAGSPRSGAPAVTAFTMS